MQGNESSEILGAIGGRLLHVAPASTQGPFKPMSNNTEDRLEVLFKMINDITKRIDRVTGRIDQLEAA